MRSSHFTEDDIATFLADAERGRSIAEICRQAQISPRTFYRWREKFGALPVRGVQTLRRLEEENRRLKQAMSLSGAALTIKPPPAPARWPFDTGPQAAPSSTRTPSAYRNSRTH